MGQVKEKQDTWEEKGPSSRRNAGLGLLGLGTQSQGTVQMHVDVSVLWHWFYLDRWGEVKN